MNVQSLTLRVYSEKTDHLSDQKIADIDDDVRDYAEQQIRYESMLYFTRLINLCNTPNLFAPIV
jgi:hypothetical protein